MNILHYSLGFPPYRTGGMTKYCLDLMAEQFKAGHHVLILWPGKIESYSEAISIKRDKNHNITDGLSVSSYELINPLPVPLCDGINDVNAFIMNKCSETFRDFFIINKVNVLHVHTLMGMPRECLEEANKLGIQTVYTSHDYFGICPKLGLTQRGRICDNNNDFIDCIECNKTALSLKKIQFLQSSLYRKIKNLPLIKAARKWHNKTIYAENTNDFSVINVRIEDEDTYEQEKAKYKKLRCYYVSMLKSFSVLHFNSSNTKEVFGKYLDVSETEKIITISHSSISDNRKVRTYFGQIRIGYLGPITVHKGFFFIKNALDELYKQNITNFQLHIFAEYEGYSDYFVKHPPYQYKDLVNVMNQFDILVVPSLSETFGFTVLEALSYGVPVIVTSNVGAKDLIENGKNGLITSPNKESIQAVIMELLSDHKKMSDMNQYIVSHTPIKIMEQHAKEIEKLYNYKGVSK